MTMPFYTLGSSGLRVTRLALGTMTFGTEWGWGADKETARALVDAYVEAGGNFFDTADAYTGGTSETWLGEFVAERGLRDRAVISTKFSMNPEQGNPNAGGNGRKNIIRAVEGSLKRLGTDYIDLYVLHAWDRLTSPEEVMRTLDDLVGAGKIRHVGLSDVPAWYASRAQSIAEQRGYEPVSALQLEYSLVERNIEHEFVPFGTRYGAGIMVWSPLASGLLSGKYRSDTISNAGGRLEAMRGSTNPGFQKFTDRNWAIVAELEKAAGELGRGMAQIALNWAATRPGVASVIIGATRLDQLRDNLGALDFEIPQELLARLDAVSLPVTPFPYSFFGPEIQGGLTGGQAVGYKPAGYFPDLLMEGAFAGVS
ncbi:aldo/keto reductase [Mesorhizobium sp. M7A.T.Ca.TU.009.01.3.2]|nr:aldo/keto reductase [Mesorhizobium sp. M7A.T.Ca.TU.009.01.3.2]RUV07846.1 aldo/keto reductase [Mesorhizobium sp. M7A.T.Ca.TU.009.01.3.1]